MKKLLEAKVAMILAAALLMGVATSPVQAEEPVVGDEVGSEAPLSGDMPQ